MKWNKFIDSDSFVLIFYVIKKVYTFFFDENNEEQKYDGMWIYASFKWIFLFWNENEFKKSFFSRNKEKMTEN